MRLAWTRKGKLSRKESVCRGACSPRGFPFWLTGGAADRFYVVSRKSLKVVVVQPGWTYKVDAAKREDRPVTLLDEQTRAFSRACWASRR